MPKKKGIQKDSARISTDALKGHYERLKKMHQELQDAFLMIERKIKDLQYEAQDIADKQKQKEILEHIHDLPNE